ncbi:MAG TPA: hypothetical protein PLQ89_17785 [Phycisphaerae bacterium]|jgi:hypothetical protein|nr:hypothetical protein [Phycisphaerae bacterium]
MTSTETLKHEHQVILMVLDAAQREARSIETTGEFSAERVAHKLADGSAPLGSLFLTMM